MIEPWVDFALNEIDGAWHRLSVWERDFIKSVRDRIAGGISLSSKQLDEITKIHRKATDIKPIPTPRTTRRF